MELDVEARVRQGVKAVLEKSIRGDDPAPQSRLPGADPDQARGGSYRRVLCAGVRGHKVGTCDILNMHSSPLQDPLLQGRGGGVETGRFRGERGGVMQDPASELPRIHIPRTPVNTAPSGPGYDLL